MECPVFGTSVTDVSDQIAATPCGVGGDYIALQDGDQFYRVSQSAVAALVAAPLDEGARGRMREWLDEEWKKGRRCPEITTERFDHCRSPA